MKWEEELKEELRLAEEELAKAKKAYDEADEGHKVALLCKMEAVQANVMRAKNHLIPVGAKVSISPYTDWHSYTIVRRTKDTLTAREDRQTTFKHCWQDGQLNCEPDESGSLIRLTWSKARRKWCYGIYKVMLGEYNYEDPSF